MRDIKGKDIIIGNITDNSINMHSTHKLLRECDSSELKTERTFRKQRLKDEKSKKIKPSIICSLIIACIALALLCFMNYEMGLKLEISTILAIPGAIFSIMSIYLYFTPNKYEQKHLNALQEINDLLRERGDN